MAAAAAALVFSQVSAYDAHTCGITTAGLAYCWGNGGFGELGNGTLDFSWTPSAVAGGHQFIQINSGSVVSCGVTTTRQAYCWGFQVGDGTEEKRLTPVPLMAGTQFLQIVSGEFHTCGVTFPDRRAFCWGDNQFGELGDGTTAYVRPSPVLVRGGHKWREISLGRWHTCAVTTSDQAYCWGRNNDGQLGTGSNPANKLLPTPVKGGHAFRQIDAGSDHTCAVTTDRHAFCWGQGKFGQIGDGKTARRYVPKAVAGGLTFDRVSAGGLHACAETSTNRAYCWGYNGWGALGDGTTTQRLAPVPVTGNLVFSQLSAGAFYTCGRTTAGAGYCWGQDDFGQLGDGTNSQFIPTPTPVSAP
jgi:alpha-tubulin suppressor-like RCC1 family protein